MADVLHIRAGLALPLSEIELRTSRSSGPGGQHANVTASRVEASFDVSASETLSAEQRARISAKLGPWGTAAAPDTGAQPPPRGALPREGPPPRTRPNPPRASQKRRLDSKRRRGDVKRARRRPDY